MMRLAVSKVGSYIKNFFDVTLAYAITIEDDSFWIRAVYSFICIKRIGETWFKPCAELIRVAKNDSSWMEFCLGLIDGADNRTRWGIILRSVVPSIISNNHQTINRVDFPRLTSAENLSKIWPDLAKFCHFGKILKVFGKLFYLLWHFLC